MPTPLPPSSPAAADRDWKRDLVLLALVFGTLLLFRLGTMPLANPDEGRYAEIAREMLVTGDWVTPRLNEVYYFEKPPLVYWTTAVCFRLFGVNEWAARLPTALFALAGILVTYAAGRRLHGRAAGVLAAFVLGTGLLYFILGRILILDMAVSALMSAALFCFILGVREAPGGRRRFFFYALYACAALATLTKGLIGFLVTGAVMASWLLVFNQWHRLRPFYLPTGALLFLAIAAPWHWLAAQRNPAWTEFYFVREHWLRFTTTTHGRHEPWWYFIPVLLAGLFPWTGFLWPAVRSAVAGGWARRRENVDTWFLVTWAAFIFLFFSRSQSKLSPYILPIFPALSVLIGAWLAEKVRQNAWRDLRGGLLFFSVGASVIALAAAVLVIHPGLIRDRDLVEAARWHALAIAGVMAAGAGLAWYFARARGAVWALAVPVFTLGMLYLLIATAVPVVIHRNTKSLAAIVSAASKPGDRVYHYHGFFHDFVFYTGQPAGTVSWPDELELDIDPEARASGRYIDDAEFLRQWNGPARIWAVARKRHVTQLFADPAFRYHLIGETRNHTLFSNQP